MLWALGDFPVLGACPSVVDVGIIADGELCGDAVVISAGVEVSNAAGGVAVARAALVVNLASAAGVADKSGGFGSSALPGRVVGARPVSGGRSGFKSGKRVGPNMTIAQMMAILAPASANEGASRNRSTIEAQMPGRPALARFALFCGRWVVCRTVVDGPRVAGPAAVSES